MTEHRLYDPADPPAWLDSAWWTDSVSCNHLDHPARVHTARLTAVAELITDTVRAHGVETVVDVGAGDGALLSLLPDDVRILAHGYDIITDSVRHARWERKVDVRKANVQTDRLDWGSGTVLAVCTEMLEHLADPHGFVRSVLSRADWLIVSSPHSETPEAHEWNHAWAWDRTGYRALVEQAGFDVVDHRTVEWSQIVLAHRRPLADTIAAAA